MLLGSMALKPEQKQLSDTDLLASCIKCRTTQLSLTELSQTISIFCYQAYKSFILTDEVFYKVTFFASAVLKVIPVYCDKTLPPSGC